MIKIKIRNKIKLNKHQFFWIEVWEELLNLYTIEPYSTPLINVHILIDDFRKIPKNKKNKKKLLEKIEEIQKLNINFEKDLILKTIPNLPDILSFLKQRFNNKEFTPEEWEKSDFSISSSTKELFYNKNIKNFKENYFHTLSFELYEIISKEVVSLHELKKIEFLTKILIAELISRKFSWYYLQTQPSIFLQKNHFIENIFQLKLNYTFSNFLREKEQWNIMFKITLKKDVLKILDYPSKIIFLDNTDTYIKNTIQNLEEELKRLKKEEKILLDLDNKENYFANQKHLDLNQVFKSIDLSQSSYQEYQLIYFFNIIRPLLFNNIDEKRKELSKPLSLQSLKSFSSPSSAKISLLKMKNYELLKKLKTVKQDIKTEDDIKAFIYLLAGGYQIKNNRKKIEKKILFLKESNNKVFAIVKSIEASDPNYAYRIAKNRLLRFVNILRYNSPNISFHINNIDNNALLIQKHHTTLLSAEKHLNYRKNLTFRENEISSHLQNINNCGSKLKYDFQDIMHFYGMYLDAQYDSQKFLSLWIGLEKLCDIEQEKSTPIGSTVVKSVSTIITIYYLRKILRNLWFDLKRLDLIHEISKKYNIEIQNDKIIEEKLFYIIKNDSKDILELIRNKTSSQILYIRIEELSETFKSTKKLYSYVHEYKQNIENSIWRLYSIRNKITHEAYIDTDLTLQIKQLEYLFKITYNNLLYVASQKKFKSIRDIFEKVYTKKYDEIWTNYNMFDQKYSDFQNKVIDPINFKQ